MALAPSTQKSYKSAQKRFTLFCRDAGASPLPVSEELLCFYVAFLAKEGLVHSSIKSYLSGLRHLQISFGFPDPFSASMPRLEQVLRGIKVNQGRQGKNAPKQKLPITPAILRRLRGLWEPHEQEPDYIMLWAACCTAFFGFLRSGEFTVPTLSGFDPSTHLSFGDVAVDNPQQPSLIQLNLKASKTDPFRKGVQVVIGATGDDLCPVTAMLAYLAVRGGAQGPLFQFGNGSPLTRTVFVSRTKAALQRLGLSAAMYAGHSFRAGAATTAAAAGLEDSLIKTMGRWESSAYLLYIRIPRAELQGVAVVLSKL